MRTEPPAIKAVFGYGSLVNTKTHTYGVTHQASLTGWRRVWKQAVDRPVAFLSIEPHGSTLHGLLAQVPEADWASLDWRERAYTRRNVNHQITHDGGALDCVAYEAHPDHTADPTSGHPILLSYLDVVIAGYADLMGDAGPDHFFDTTVNWGPVLDDRIDPLYPRARPLAQAIRTRVDTALRDLAVPVQPAEGADLLVKAIRIDGPA